MREHDKIVNNLKDKLESKGFKLWSFPKDEAMIAQRGYSSIKPIIKHTEFKPDIIMSGSEKHEDRFFIEYVLKSLNKYSQEIFLKYLDG